MALLHGSVWCLLHCIDVWKYGNSQGKVHKDEYVNIDLKETKQPRVDMSTFHWLTNIISNNKILFLTHGDKVWWIDEVCSLSTSFFRYHMLFWWPEWNVKATSMKIYNRMKICMRGECEVLKTTAVSNWFTFTIYISSVHFE